MDVKKFISANAYIPFQPWQMPLRGLEYQLSNSNQKRADCCLGFPQQSLHDWHPTRVNIIAITFRWSAHPLSSPPLAPGLLLLLLLPGRSPFLPLGEVALVAQDSSPGGIPGPLLMPTSPVGMLIPPVGFEGAMSCDCQAGESMERRQNQIGECERE